MLGRPFGDMYPASAAGPDAGQALVVETLNVDGIVQDLSLVAPRGKILCIAGQIGSGANVVTRALAGLVPVRAAVSASTASPCSSARRRVAWSAMSCSCPRIAPAEGIFHQRSVLENLLAGSFNAHTRFRILDWLQLRRVGARLASALPSISAGSAPPRASSVAATSRSSCSAVPSSGRSRACC
jgi:ABC-type sugar transport system ATPase subunit